MGQKGQVVGVMDEQFSFNGTREKSLDYAYWSNQTKTYLDCDIDTVTISCFWFWGYFKNGK